jgi:hypothetical protein
VQRLAVIALVGNKFGGGWRRSDTGLGELAVVNVAQRQQEGMRASLGVSNDTDLGVAPAFGAADTMA